MVWSSFERADIVVTATFLAPIDTAVFVVVNFVVSTSAILPFVCPHALVKCGIFDSCVILLQLLNFVPPTFLGISYAAVVVGCVVADMA